MKKLTKIDELTLYQHHYLDPDDECHYFGEYIAKGGYDTEFNQLILNFKIRPSDIARNPRRQYHKNQAISKCAEMFKGAIYDKFPAHFIPMPPSKCEDDPNYDDRTLQLCAQICDGNKNWILTDLLRPKRTIEAFHSISGKRPTPSELADILIVSDARYKLNTDTIFLVDDVLTTGSHYKAAKSILLNRFGHGIDVIGLFIARTIHPSPLDDFEDVSDQF